MTLFDRIQRGDEAVIALHQAIYNYLWDRWGVFVGTYRTWMIVFAFIDSIIIDVIDAFDPKRGLVVAIPGLLFTFALIWIGFARIHLGKEAKLQAEGKFDELNRSAMNYQGRVGLIWRVVLLMILVGIMQFFERTLAMTLMRYLSIFFFVMWCYSCAVMVRDREPDRFLKAVPQGT